jgi:hypothetical protein
MSCPVCFGGGDDGVRESLNAGIGVLLGVTVVVLGLFARFFIQLARRSREAAKWGRTSLVEDSLVSRSSGVLHK